MNKTDLPVDFPPTEKMMPKSNRALILRSLVPIASSLASEYLQTFLSRLSDVLGQHATQKVRPAEALLSADALIYLKKNSLQFYASAPGYLTQLLIEEIDAAESKPHRKNHSADQGSATFDETENKGLIGKLGQSIECDNAEVLAALNKRIAYLLQARTVNISRNPFRPEIFVQALFGAWCDFHPVPESHSMILRLLRVEMFPYIGLILQALNESLIGRGILLDQSEPTTMPIDEQTDTSASRSAGRKEPLLNTKLRQMLPDEEASIGDLLIPNLFPAEGTESGTGAMDIATRLQQEMYLELSDGALPEVADATILHRFKSQVPSGMLTKNQEISVGFLINIYEFIFADESLEEEIKALIAPLQIPTLKAALLNKDFFFKETHPARHLLESLVKAGMFWNSEGVGQDPLYQAIKNSVDQVKCEVEPLSGLFAAVVADFESFIAEEGGWSEIALTEPIAEALRQEKIRLSLDLARSEVATRIETGEVAGFVEKFLEKYWVSVLALAHSVKDDKPDALDSALKTMDDLIWSMKPKSSPEERKELLAKLPSLLSLINVWLNTIKCDDLDRATFFTKLAERHASIVRSDLSLRGQIEFAVNVAEKVSERRLKKNGNESHGKRWDKYTLLVNRLVLGDCVEFVDENDVQKKFKLAWISAKRSILLFSNHQGQDAFSVTAEDLANSLSVDRARILVWTSVVDRALSLALTTSGAEPRTTFSS